ncbi:hypothetical protein JKP88DRAFT_266587, partial [Tribonema minus]
MMDPAIGAGAQQKDSGHDGGVQQDCHFFLKTGCRRGAECKFRHSEVAKANPVPCRYWPMGTCKSGSACAFVHSGPPPAAQQQAPPQQQQHAQQQQQPAPSGGLRTCIYFAQGNCANGDACPYVHCMAPAVQPENPMRALRELSSGREMKGSGAGRGGGRGRNGSGLDRSGGGGGVAGGSGGGGRQQGQAAAAAAAAAPAPVQQEAGVDVDTLPMGTVVMRPGGPRIMTP